MLTGLAGKAKLSGLARSVIPILEAEHARLYEALDGAGDDDLALLKECAELINRQQDRILVLNQRQMIGDVRDDRRQLLPGQLGLQ